MRRIFVGMFYGPGERMMSVALYFLVLKGVIIPVCSQPIDSLDDDVPLSDMVGYYYTYNNILSAYQNPLNRNSLPTNEYFISYIKS